MPEKRVSGRVLVWFLGACALLLFHVAAWTRIARTGGLRLPTTPIDRVTADGAAQWRLLMDARPWIPAGSEYTVHASDADREMNLYMLSLGVFPRAKALPTHYYAMDFSVIGDRARYVIDEGCRGSNNLRIRTLARFAGGCVERRE
jgi:hypothetical protein